MKNFLIFLMVIGSFTLTGVFGWQLYHQPPQVKETIKYVPVYKTVVKKIKPPLCPYCGKRHWK